MTNHIDEEFEQLLAEEEAIERAAVTELPLPDDLTEAEAAFLRNLRNSSIRLVLALRGFR